MNKSFYDSRKFCIALFLPELLLPFPLAWSSSGMPPEHTPAAFLTYPDEYKVVVTASFLRKPVH